MNHLNVIEAVRKMVRQAHHPCKGPVGPEPVEGMGTVKPTDGCSRKAGVVALMHAVLGFLFVFTSSAAGVVDIVKDGKPVAVIVVQQTGEQQAPNQRGKSSRAGFELSDIGAADVLADWIEKITDARLARRRPGLELTSPPAGAWAGQPPEGAPAIYIGAAALKAGLSLDQIQSPTGEGLRIVCDGAGKILIAGQNDSSTTKAVCRFLEELGCRYFMDNDLGEVYPRTKTLAVGKLDISEKPGFLLRKIWGSQWTGSSLWKIWNGDGGLPMSTGHAWGKYVDENLFEQHPEYFALRDGSRKKGSWYCTSNPQLRKIFTDGVIAKGGYNPSLSPPDGTGYCQCDKCLAQDDPANIEPSSGRPSVTNRYVDFFDEVAADIAKAHPDRLLSFYCYADYTQPPTLARKLSPNLVAWIAPLRYSRYHRIGSPNSPSCMQLVNVIDGWADVANHIAYRTYNFNCAECLVPFSKLSIWKHDIPYLKKKGCIGINLESLANWEIYGPHLYQSIRIAYNPDTDSDVLMDDYFTKFYGAEAGPLMKEYWLTIDKAFAELKCESGGFFALHLVYTRQFLQELEALIKKASSVTALNKTYSARVAMTGEGLKNAAQYIDVREAMNNGDFSAARRIYDELCARNEAEQKKGYGNHYTLNYLRRFIGPLVAAGTQATAPPNKVLLVLPDIMKLEYDREDNGLAKGFHKAEFDDSKWKDAATYSSTLNAQGLPDVKSIMWYRTSIDVPRRHGPLTLFFTEVDGQSVAVYLNGKEAASLGSEARRKPFEVDITGVAEPGQNTLSLRIDHSRITELFLGGIVRPVLLIEKPARRYLGGPAP